MTKVAVITQTPPTGATTIPQANLIKTAFDSLVWQKGYDVIKETALRCPCQGKNTGQQSNCKNCGGTSWIFINPTATRMVFHSMNRSTKYKEWSEESGGNASVTCMQEEVLSFMDRITILAGNAIFGQVLFLKTHIGTDESTSASESQSASESFDNTVYYFNTAYDIKEILYVGLFNGSQNKLKPLIYGTDFTYEANKIIFLTATSYINPLATEQDISITVRYKHAPQMHIIDIPRETIQTFNKFSTSSEEGPIDLPIHAIARRSHYVLDADNYDKTRILNNDNITQHDDLNPHVDVC